MKKLVFKRSDIISFFRDVTGILLGTFLCGAAYTLFLIPFKACPGGVGGLSQILYFMLDIPVGYAMLFFNIPLFFIGVFTIGRGFGFKTVLAILGMSFFTELTSHKILSKISYFNDFFYLVSEPEGIYALTNEYFLAVLAGSLMLGIGIGLIIVCNGSTGGTDIPVLLLRKYFGISVGNGYLIVETVIIFFTGVVFKNGNLILWGLLALYISARVTDLVIEGYSRTKAVMVISDKQDEIKQYILKNLERGCTIIKGEGGYTRQEKNIIYVIVHRRELPRFKHQIRKIDSDSFVIVNDVFETLGFGFKRL